MDLDLSTLRIIVQNATPGPWELVGSSLTDWDNGTYTMEWAPNGDYPNRANDAAYLVVMNPTVIGALLDRLEAAERNVLPAPLPMWADEGDDFDQKIPGEDSLTTAVRWIVEYLEAFHPTEPCRVIPDGNIVRVLFRNAGPVLPASMNGHQVAADRYLGDAFQPPSR
jgi:hypothetical protein